MRRFLTEFHMAAVWAGVTAFIFMVFGALTVQLSVLEQFGLSEPERSSWITVTWLTAALVTLPICFYYKQPLAIGWTLPGLIYMGSLADRFTLPEFAGANLVAGLAILAIGVAGFGSRIVYVIPMPILMAMFGASILEYEIRLVDATADRALVAGPMVIAYLVGRLLNLRQVPPVGLAVITGALAVAVLGDFGSFTVDSTLPGLHAPGVDLSVEALLSVSLPMVILVLGLGNVQSLGFMMAEGYRPPLNTVTAMIGGMTAVNAAFGGHPAAMARTVTAMVAGREAGDLGSRYWAAVVAFVPALGIALATGFVVALVGTLPPAFILAMAGLAILAPFQDAMARGFSGVLRFGCVVAFVVTLSDFEVEGIPSAFWALIAGVGASALLEWHELRRYWRTAFAEPHAPIDHVLESMEIRRWEAENAW